MEKSVRQMINERKLKILDDKPRSKEELAKIGIELAGLLINIGQEKAKLEQKAYRYKKKWIKNENFSDAKAETFMRASDRWLNFKTVKILYDTTKELIRMIKVRIKDVQDEFENI